MKEAFVSLVVMLSGQGKRFGGNKLMAEFDGEPLFRYALGQAADSGAGHVTVVSAWQEILDYCQEHYPDMSAVYNKEPDLGISASIRLGLSSEMGLSYPYTHRASFPDGCCFLTGDMPLLKASSLSRLINDFKSHPTSICMLSNGLHQGNPAVFPRDLYPQLLALEGNQRGKSVADRYTGRIRVTMVERQELYDIDTAWDMCRLQNMLKLQ